MIRRGVRVGRPTLVVHAATRGPAGGAAAGSASTDGTPAADAVPRVGFVVSKAVGNAVIRNRVKRRLRELARAELSATGDAVVPPRGTDLVIRALPPAAASGDLAEEFHSAWRGSLKKLSGSGRR